MGRGKCDDGPLGSGECVREHGYWCGMSSPKSAGGETGPLSDVPRRKLRLAAGELHAPMAGSRAQGRLSRMTRPQKCTFGESASPYPRPSSFPVSVSVSIRSLEIAWIQMQTVTRFLPEVCGALPPPPSVRRTGSRRAGASTLTPFSPPPHVQSPRGQCLQENRVNGNRAPPDVIAAGDAKLYNRTPAGRCVM